MVKGLVVELENGAAKEGISAEDAVLTPAYIKDEEQSTICWQEKGDKVVSILQKLMKMKLNQFVPVGKETVKDLTSDFEIELKLLVTLRAK